MAVSRVDSRARRQQWVRLPYQVYKDDPAWVPPLESEVRRTMSPRSNPLLRRAEVDHFVAGRVGRGTAGRLAVCVDPDFVSRTGTRAAFFGFFESLADDEAATALLDRAAAWAHERGMVRLLGPFNYIPNQEQGLLIDGFGTPPALFQSYNPPYYASLLEAWGMQPVYRMGTYRLTESSYAGAAERCRRLGARASRLHGLSTRSLDMQRFDQEVEAVRGLLNRSFSENRNFVPYTPQDFGRQAGAMRRFIDPDQVVLVERAGELVGCALVLPNINEVLSRLNGRLGLLELLRLSRFLSEVSSLVVAMIGVSPDLKGTGAGLAIVHGVVKAVADSRYKALHTSFIDDDNRAARGLADGLRFSREKSYAIYSREI